MICYECELSGTRQDAVALCHHCSAALCAEHAVALPDPITEQSPILRVVVLPLQARLFLCHTCMRALEQTTNAAREHVGPVRSESDLVHTS
jgi:hypothetical protein